MTSLRESGWEAFQRGEYEEAIRLLRLACREDPSDYQAHLILGAVYGKTEQHEDAITTLIAAVHLQPAAALARYNLGVALEKAGHIDSAIEAFRQAVTLDPGYFKAKEALHRLDASIGAAAPTMAPVGSTFLNATTSFEPPAVHKTEEMAPTTHLPSDDGPGWSGPSRPSAVQSFSPNRPAHFAHEARGDGADTARPEGTESPGFFSHATPTSAALPTHGLLSEYVPSPHAPEGPTATFPPYEGSLHPPNFNDEIDIPKAFRDFGRILVTPYKLLAEQAGNKGMMSPILMIGVYFICELVSEIIRNRFSGVFGLFTGLILSPKSLAAACAWMAVWYLMGALIIHFLGCLFGNRQDYAMSFKACVYAGAPRLVTSILLSIYLAAYIMPAFLANPITEADINRAMGMPPASTASGRAAEDPDRPAPIDKGSTQSSKETSAPSARTTQPNPTPESVMRLVSLVWNRAGHWVLSYFIVYAIGWIWSTVLLVMGIHKLQQISPGASAAVVFLAYAICIMLVLILVFGFAGAMFALVNWAIHATGAAGGAVPH